MLSSRYLNKIKTSVWYLLVSVGPPSIIDFLFIFSLADDDDDDDEIIANTSSSENSRFEEGPLRESTEFSLATKTSFSLNFFWKFCLTLY